MRFQVKYVRQLFSFVALAAVAAFSARDADAQLVRYNVSWDNPVSHYFDIEMSFTNPEDGAVQVRIPSWRPGRYRIQNYAKNVIRFAASDGSGNPLQFRKIDKATWQIQAAPGQDVSVTYQVYANQLDAGASYLDATEAYMNPITMLMYIPGRELEPVVMSVEKPGDWITATALDFSTEMDGYWAEDYHELVDSPFIISPTLEMHSFELAGTTFEIAIQGEGKYDAGKLVADLRAIAEAQTAIMGVIPFDRYVFLFHFLDRPFGHGVEHKNSTSIVVGPADFTNAGLYRRLIGVSSHELWHVWLVERIRPEAIYHPDYSKEAYTTTFWLYEGVTSYYGGLTLTHASLVDEDAYLRGLAGAIQRFEEDPAREHTSVAMTSWDSWTKGVEAPPYSYYSFYTAGQVLGMLLDLEVRGRTRNAQSLDDVMRYLYQNYAARDIGVPEDGFQEALETITSGTFAPFFEDHVYGTRPIDYDRILFHAGYRLERGTDDSKSPVDLGIRLERGSGELKLTGVKPNGAAFEAGMIVGDVIISIGGKQATRENLDDLIADREVGDTVSVAVFRGKDLMEFDVVLRDGGNVKYELIRLDNTNTLQNQTRRDWLRLAAG